MASNPIKAEWVSDDGAVRLLLGDCLEILPTLEDGSVDAVVTDPPYGIEFMPGQFENIGGASHQSIAGDDIPFDFSPFESLPYEEQFWFGAQNYKRLGPGSWMCWDKYPTDRNDKRLSGAFEIIWSKNRHKSRLIRVKAINTSWVTTKEHAGHPTQKPVRLIEELVRYCKTGKTVADFYMGSGTTGVACIRTGRKFIGMEIEPKHFDTAVQRCEREIARFPLFEQSAKPEQKTLLSDVDMAECGKPKRGKRKKPSKR